MPSWTFEEIACYNNGLPKKTVLHRILTRGGRLAAQDRVGPF